MKNILVTGGAGYIGSVTVKMLCDLGYNVTVLDDLSKGKKIYVDKRASFCLLDIVDYKILQRKLSGKRFDAIIHLAALKDVGESMLHPEKYSDNIIAILNVTNIASSLGVKKIIFSSTSAVYGPFEGRIVSEKAICSPVSFYGYTKLIGEQILDWNKKLKNIDYVIFRYFNVAGDGGLSYINKNAQNIFNVIAEVFSGKRKYLEIFGNDYDTIDGTGVRDYVHVSDIADAHIKALSLEGSHIMNLGTKKGYSVLEILKEFENVSGKKIKYKIAQKRKGDIAKILADTSRAKKILGWVPKYNLKNMVESTLAAYKKSK